MDIREKNTSEGVADALSLGQDNNLELNLTLKGDKRLVNNAISNHMISYLGTMKHINANFSNYRRAEAKEFLDYYFCHPIYKYFCLGFYAILFFKRRHWLTPVFTSQSVFVFAIVNEFGLLWKKGSLYGDLLSQAMQEKHRYEMLSKSILDTMTPWEIVRTAIEPNYKIIDAIKPTPEEMETKEKLIKYALYQNLLETN